MLVFSNPGLIDIRAATTMGINAKEHDNAIGFFGTGLNYSIACILRWGGEIEIWRGLDRFKFSAVECTTRGKTFNIVCMNGAELGFVTDYGKTWEPWQVYRELYTNAMDEHGMVESLPTQLFANTDSDKTLVVVDCEMLNIAHEERWKFILQDHPIFASAHCDLHQLKGGPAQNAIFYQGLKVQTGRPALFSYNLRHHVDLTEDRTLKYYHQAEYGCVAVVNELCRSDNPHDHDLARQILLAPKDTYEQQVSFSWGGLLEPLCDEFWAFVEKLARRNLVNLNPSVVLMLKARKPMHESIDVFEPSEFQNRMIATAIEFCTALGYRIDEYEIVYAEKLGERMLGMAYEGKIYVTRDALSRGTKDLAATFIEEYLHLSEGVGDYTRQMQDLLFNRLITLGEEYVWKKPL